jgi:hypothetical protein
MLAISILEIWFKVNRIVGFAEFSTKSPSLPFSFFNEIELKSLTFLIFCLDKGVHFRFYFCFYRFQMRDNIKLIIFL